MAAAGSSSSQYLGEGSPGMSEDAQSSEVPALSAVNDSTIERILRLSSSDCP